jgi:hypothetical protein
MPPLPIIIMWPAAHGRPAALQGVEYPLLVGAERA